MSSSEPDGGDLDRLLSTKHIAEKTDFSPRTYEGWRMRGVGPPYVRVHNGQCRYHLRVVLDYFRNHGRVAS